MNARSETGPTASRAVGPSRRRRSRGIRGRENLAGWIYVLPALLVLGLFLLIPVIMAAWVSVSNWGGRGSPFSSDVSFVGTDNYRAILLGGGLATQDFGTALRNNSYYVLFVVPMQTVLSLYLAIMVNRRILRGRGFFRTAFYFPSVTSSVAITVLWLFLFSATGVVNAALAMVGIDGPNWFNDPRGLIHVFLSWAGVDSAPAWATSWGFLGISGWEWLAGPSIAMFALMLMAVFTV